MTKENVDIGNPTDDEAEDAVFGSEDNFFEALDDTVNGAIQDNLSQAEVTPKPTSDPAPQATPQRAPDSEVTDWEQRYKDSSREALRMREELNVLKPFVPVLNAMKSDTGLVEHVRDYLRSGGAPQKSVKENLGLDEDFEFNPHDLEDPESDSSKLVTAQVDGVVQQRINQVLSKERSNIQRAQANKMRVAQAAEFMKKNNMSKEDFQVMMTEARKRQLTLDDIHLLLNKDQVKSNVARSTKKDMLTQMKKVRDIPTSASGANSAKTDKNYDDAVFDALVGSDGDIDNLFG